MVKKTKGAQAKFQKEAYTQSGDRVPLPSKADSMLKPRKKKTMKKKGY